MENTQEQPTDLEQQQKNTKSDNSRQHNSYWKSRTGLRYITILVLLIVCAAVLIPVGLVVIRKDASAGNDKCKGAYELQVNGPYLNGTFKDASYDKALSYCGVASSSPHLFDIVGVWYKFEGTGNAARVILNPPSDYISTAVYHGPSCEILFNAKLEAWGGGYADHSGCVSNDEPFPTIEGEMHYVYVAANLGYTGEEKEFQISVVTATPPVNDLCEDAIELIFDSTVAGTLRDATWKPYPSCPFTAWMRDLRFDECPGCSSRGVWYFVRGTGGAMGFSIVNATDTDNIAIYEGFGCDSFWSIPGLVTLNATHLCPDCHLGMTCYNGKCIYLQSRADQIYWIYIYTYAKGAPGTPFGVMVKSLPVTQ